MLQRNGQQQRQQQHPSDRKTHQMAFVVVLLSCSLTCAVVSGTKEATPSQPEAIALGSMVELWNSQVLQFLKEFMETMTSQGLRCESAEEQDLMVLRLVEEASQLRKNLEEGIRGGQKTHSAVGGTGQGVAAESTSSNKEDVKKSAADMLRDYKLKTLFRWGKRSSAE